MTEENNVARPALLQARAHALHLDAEPRVTQALLESAIFPRGLYRPLLLSVENATGPLSTSSRIASNTPPRSRIESETSPGATRTRLSFNG